MNRTAVIIGGGMGGLFTGALLAKNGWRITVLEKNAVIGGGLQTFFRDGESFDPGIHIIGGFRKGGTLNRICSYLGVLDRLKLKQADPDCMDYLHLLSSGKRFRIPEGRNEYAAYFSTLFPSEAEGIRAYTDAIYRLTEEVGLYYLRYDRRGIYGHSEEFYLSADEFIAKYIANRELRSILSYTNVLYGGVQSHTPAFVHALVTVLYIEGEDRFVGGGNQLAEALVGVIEEAGGKVERSAPVSRIVCEEREVKEVRTEDGRSFSAQWYISDVHPCHLLSFLEPKDLPKAYRNRLEEIPNSCSCFLMYIKFKENSFRYINHSCFIAKDFSTVWDLGRYDGNWPRGFMYLTPPVEDQGEFTRKMTITAPMSFDAVRRWENTTIGKRGDDYRSWKLEQCGKILDLMETEYPGFRSAVEKYWSSSPLTIRDWFNTKEGAMYGYRKDSANLIQSQLAVKTKISNLLLTGQNVNLHGICGVPLTALDTAEALLGRNSIIRQINGKM